MALEVINGQIYNAYSEVERAIGHTPSNEEMQAFFKLAEEKLIGLIGDMIGDAIITEILNNKEYEKRSAEPVEYEINVIRCGYSSKNIKVMAHSQKEAEQLALDEAGDHEFSEHNAEYVVG